MQRGGAQEVSPAQAAGVPVAEALVASIWTLELEVVGNQLHLALNPGNQGNDGSLKDTETGEGDFRPPGRVQLCLSGEGLFLTSQSPSARSCHPVTAASQPGGIHNHPSKAPYPHRLLFSKPRTPFPFLCVYVTPPVF